MNLRSFGKDTILYAAGTFLRRVAAFLLIPLYTANLSVFDYGALETLTVTAQTSIILFGFGLSNALLRYYPAAKNENDALVMVRTSAAAVTVFAMAMLIAIAPAFPALSQGLFKSSAYVPSLWLAAIWAIGGALNEHAFAYWRAKRSSMIFVGASSLMLLAMFGFNVLFLVKFQWGVNGVLLGNAMAAWIINLWLGVVLLRHGVSISLDWLQLLVLFSWPLVISRIGWLTLNSADRYILAYFRDLSEVGIYALGYKVGLIVSILIITPFQLAWAPFVFAREKMDLEQNLADFARIFTYLLLAFAGAGLMLLLYSYEAVTILGSGKYEAAVAVVPYVILAYLAQAVFYWAGSFMHLKHRTLQLSAVVMVAAILNILLNILLIPQFGWQGAAITTTVTISLAGFGTLLLSRRYFPVPLETGRIIRIIFGASVVVLLYYSFPQPATVMGITLRFGFWMVLPLTLWLTNFFDAREIKLLGEFREKLPVHSSKIAP